MVDRYLKVLANGYRRRLLTELIERHPSEEIPVPESVHKGKKDLADLHVELVHHHLPRMEQLDLIGWDREEQTVSRGSRFADIEPLLEAVIGVTGEQRDKDPSSVSQEESVTDAYGVPGRSMPGEESIAENGEDENHEEPNHDCF